MRTWLDEDLYEVLGVRSDADPGAIERAFLQAARRAHPDVSGDPEAFKRINEAYRVLGDAELRRSYDESRREDRSDPPPTSGGVQTENNETSLDDEADRAWDQFVWHGGAGPSRPSMYVPSVAVLPVLGRRGGVLAVLMSIATILIGVLVLPMVFEVAIQFLIAAVALLLGILLLAVVLVGAAIAMVFFVIGALLPDR